MCVTKQRILVTGAQGFLGKNFVMRLTESNHMEAISFGRENSLADLKTMIKQADAIVHFAGENRPQNSSAFDEVNVGLTKALCDAVVESKKVIPIIFASSTQAATETEYGVSKRKAEDLLINFSKTNNSSVTIFRLPGVFGKWSRPNYNSVVVTFCYNIARGIPITIHQKDAIVALAYIDDVMSAIFKVLEYPKKGLVWRQVEPIYNISVGELAEQIKAFKSNQRPSMVAEVGTGLKRALFSTYISYLPHQDFTYSIPQHNDQRGTFVEMLKTKNSGQFSYFTARPGVTRGGHYHHTKTEKFLVIKGHALFRFRNLITNEKKEIKTDGHNPTVVVTIPGWVHDVKNIGKDELIVMVWANENFDQDAPDTIASQLA